jgi:hypothetical protein
MMSELDNGVVVRQLTQEDRLVSNLYCERPFCGADSRRFLYARQLDGAGPDQLQSWEYVLCEFGTWREEVVGEGFLQVSISYRNDFYFQRPRGEGLTEFVRLDLGTGSLTPVWECPPGTVRAGHPTVSADGKLLAYHYPVSFDPQTFGVAVVDLETGERNTVHEDPFLCNAHLQFHPTRESTLLVQHNRGCEFTPEGKRLRLTGDEGATLFLLDALSGDVERLKIGKPYTPPITGHEAWLGASDTVIATVAPEDDFVAGEGKGTTFTVARGEECRQLGTGIVLNHIGTTHCGRYFFGDSIRRDYIAIGSPKTGKVVIVHEGPEDDPGGSPFGQQSHPHAYLTPDFKWMVFNSDATGRPQLYVAEIPPELLDGLEDG